MLNVISIIQCIDQVFTNLIFIPMIFCPVCEIPSEKAMDQKAQEHLPALSGTDQLIPATDFL